MTTFVTIIFIIVSLFMVLAILLQAGKGGGLGSALGGGASQTVFGGGGGADFMAKLTQGFAATFMICAMYLAYASAHSGSDFLQRKSKELEDASRLASAGGEVDYERVGPNPLRLPTPDEARSMRGAAGSSPAPATDGEADPAAEPEPPAE
jgi:preprotein translocase subunit SecG